MNCRQSSRDDGVDGLIAKPFLLASRTKLHHCLVARRFRLGRAASSWLSTSKGSPISRIRLACLSQRRGCAGRAQMGTNEQTAMHTAPRTSCRRLATTTCPGRGPRRTGLSGDTCTMQLALVSSSSSPGSKYGRTSGPHIARDEVPPVSLFRKLNENAGQTLHAGSQLTSEYVRLTPLHQTR